ncbi:MAG: nucleotidyltransferase domain-containing protein [Nanoarchaeota archaeon]
MKEKNADDILKKVLEKIQPSKEELKKISGDISDFKRKVGRRIKQFGIKAEIFIGGSFAKKTMIRKDVYDVDVFIRFDKSHKDISNLTKKILTDFKKTETKGSRNYFIIDKGDFFIEVVPVIKTKSSSAENVTDLSHSHVAYIRKKLAGEKMLNEVKLAKAFCYANKCYGAESYVNGFSGYALELLVYHYGSFMKFIKAFEKIKEREVIDTERHFKNKNEVFMDLNEAKLKSPVILIDPTYKKRNALAALSKETFEGFKKICKEFLKNPSEKFFELKKIDFESAGNSARRKKLEFVSIRLKTGKQEGDIAGTKLLKFFNHLKNEVEKFFIVKESGFEYSGENWADGFFSCKNKGEIILQGPSTKQENNVKAFTGAHKNTFSKSGRIYAKEKIKFDLRKFLEDWKKKNSKKMEDMSVSELKII